MDSRPATYGDVAKALKKWLDRSRHLTPADGYEIGVMMSGLLSALVSETNAPAGTGSQMRMVVIGDLQLLLREMKAPVELVTMVGQVRLAGARTRPRADGAVAPAEKPAVREPPEGYTKPRWPRVK